MNCAVLRSYDAPDDIMQKWAVKDSDRATSSARVTHVLNYIQGTSQDRGASKSLIATATLRKGEVAFLYRGATLSSSCVSEYEDHQLSVEVLNCYTVLACSIAGLSLRQQALSGAPQKYPQR